MKKLTIFTTLFLFAILTIQAQKIPQLKGYVNDYAGVLSSSEERNISEMLSQLERNTSAQVAVLTVDNLQGYSLESFSMSVVEDWKLGQNNRDNGILILLSMAEKKVRIEVGYGLEGDITDAKSGYIIRNIIIPEFRKGNFGMGLYKGAEAVSSIVSGSSDISSQELAEYNKDKRQSSSGGVSFNVVIFIIIFLLSSLARGRRRGGLFNALLWGSLLGGGRHRGGGGFSGGGGFGGGGFSGGGGGGFGGGGASGGW